MSRLQGKPYAQKVVESLDATERANLLGLLNGSSLTPAFRSLTNASAYITDADEGVSHISLETADGNLTGYLVYTDDYVTLFAYERNSQGIAQYEIDLDAMTIKVIDETLDIEGLRTIVTDSLKADLVGGKVPAEQLPSYVDDVLEYEDLAHFPAEGEYGKIYIALDTGSTYRWGGTEYVQIGGSTATPMVSITWAELKALRDAGELLPGQQYRITDYTFTTTTNYTSSANHAFDIIVTAEDESHLEEEAFAAHHAGDTYFSGNKLEAWRLWYSLDNDTNRFKWADATNGKGVIYRMIDEFNNDIPYDFKNCLFNTYYTFHKSSGDASLVKTSDNKVHDNVMGEWIDILENGKQCLNFNYFFKTNASDMSVYENTFGRDCHGITCEGNLFYRNTFGDNCYTFIFNGSSIYQNKFGNSCHDNSSGGNFRYNTLGTNCYYHTFGSTCDYNILGPNCHDNTFQIGCAYNTFGPSCYNNTFGTNCSYNTFGPICYGNTFGNNCTDNEFGTECKNNNFGTSCAKNTFGTGCHDNTFGSTCENNTFESTCLHNTFGNNCSRNELSSDLAYISIGNNVANNYFGVGSSYITLGRRIYDCRFGNSCKYITIGSTSADYYATYLTFDSGVQYVNLTSSDDANASSSNYLRNIHVHSGISGVSGTPVSIVVPERGQSHSYDYYATNSVDVMI